ncbi:MAG: methyltransferase domain-containing protein [Gemmatimonadota bacterium]|nr:MAG: methyltransferase domain-containing protein [Gemmatimonadota bacterium]
MTSYSSNGSVIGSGGVDIATAPCPSCHSLETEIFHQISQVPVNSVLNIRGRDEALQFPRGDLALAFCTRCGFISNSLFDSRLVEYSSECEESQGCSPTFGAFARDFANSLIQKHDLRNKEILEIGCGKGEFLDLICSLGHNHGVGFDPAYVPGRYHHQAQDRLTFIRDFYSEAYAEFYGDLICCRMTLEHIQHTTGLVNLVAQAIRGRDSAVTAFQVPNVIRILQKCSFEDIYYEHCSYFSPGSLARLFRSCGLDVLDLYTAYDEQYIVIEGTAASKPPQELHPLENDLDLLSRHVQHFRQTCPRVVQYWEDRLADFHADGKKVVLWGSGSKGVAFLNTLSGSDTIQHVVDINPHRQGTYMAGTGQSIVAPVALKAIMPDAVIVMNPIYRQEIQEELNVMQLEPELHALGDHVESADEP